MPWTKTARIQYQRDGLRYASDLTDAEWALMTPEDAAATAIGSAAGGRFARDRPGDLLCPVEWLPMASLAEGVPAILDSAGLFLRLARHRQMAGDCRISSSEGAPATGTKAQPTAAVIDSQTASTTEAGGPRGFDAGKRLHGRKRHIVTDTNGLLLAAYVHPANIQDVHGAVPLLEDLRGRFPRFQHVFADRIYRGKQLVNALSDCGPWTIEIVERPHGVKGFQLLPRRWVVERTFAWFGRCRRLSKDFERSAATRARLAARRPSKAPNSPSSQALIASTRFLSQALRLAREDREGGVRLLGVQSRGQVEWIEPEAVRLFCPGRADGFVGCKAT